MGIGFLIFTIDLVNRELKEQYGIDKFYRFLTILVMIVSFLILFGITYESTIQAYTTANW